MTKPKFQANDGHTCECGKTVFARTSLFWVAIVDVEDGHWLRDYKWSAAGTSLDAPFYAVSGRYRYETGKSPKLHRVVMNHAHEQYDHVNYNGHDCRRSNLRPCTNAENARHARRHYPNSTSKYRGVRRVGNKWQATIMVDGQKLYLRLFGFESDAAIAYNFHAAHYFGEFAKLTKITEYFHD